MIRYQRGFGIIDIIMYVAIAGVAWGAWLGFKHWVTAPAVEKQRVADKKIADKLEQERDDAERDKQTAKDNQDRCDATLLIAQKATTEWLAAATRAEAAAKAAKADAAREFAALAPKISEWQAAAAAKPQLMSCNVELEKTKNTLREALRIRRQPPPLPAPPGAK